VVGVHLRRKVTAGTANHGEHDALRFKTLEANVATNWFRTINESVGTYYPLKIYVRPTANKGVVVDEITNEIFQLTDDLTTWMH